MSNENAKPPADLSSWLTPEAKAGVEGLLARPDIKMALSQVRMDDAQPAPTSHRNTVEVVRSQDEPGIKK